MLYFLATAPAGAEGVIEHAATTLESAITLQRVLIAAALAAISMSSVVIGAWLGLTFKASDKLIANILAFGSGALVNALAVDLAYGTTEHLIHEGLSNVEAWAYVAGGFLAGGLIYFWSNRYVDSRGGAARHKTNAKAFVLDHKREEAAELLERLGKNAVLRSLPPSEIDSLLPYIREFTIDQGKTLFHQGEAGDAMYLIDSGRLGVSPAPKMEPKMHRTGSPKSKEAILLAKWLCSPIAAAARPSSRKHRSKVSESIKMISSIC